MTTTLELAGRSRMPSDVGRAVVPILIQVPNMTAHGHRPVPARRRRRLRKEVRFAGLTMMSVLPVGFLLLALGGAQPVERPARGATRGDELARVASAAPLAEASVASARVPVVFHDYLLPVDGPEEAEHAGR
jgi:hypothetical protein